MMLLCDCCCCWCSSEGGILVLPAERRIDPMEMVDNAAASLFSTIPGFLERPAGVVWWGYCWGCRLVGY